MDDYCVNCKVFRNLNNLLDKVDVTNFNYHSIDEGYGTDPMNYSEYHILTEIQVFRCEYCRSIYFKDYESNGD